jgi:hypothetical protein
MSRSALAWALLALAPVFLLIAFVLDLVAGGDVFEVLAFLVLALPYAIVGALIAARQPSQPIGWLMLGCGLGLTAALACDGVVNVGLQAELATLAGAFALISSLLFSVFFLCLVTTLLLLPNGRFASPRWQLAGGAIAVLAVFDLAGIVKPGVFSDWTKEGVRNPLGVEALGGLAGALEQGAIMLTFALLLTGIVSIGVRFRRAQGVERQQLRWIVTAGTATGLAWALMIMASFALPEGRALDTFWAISLLSIGLIPVGVGFAVLRYRLYDIDRVVSKALVYGSLTALLALAYVGLVLAGQALSSSFAGSSNLAIAISTLAVAALFLPARAHVQRFVDRRFYRRRYDAQRTLEGFGARLRGHVDLATLEHDLHGVMSETMQPAHASVWRREAPR